MRQFALLLGLTVVLAGCDAYTSRPDPLATRIEELRVEPNPVRVGEQTTFTVIHPDTASTSFEYYWSVANGVETTVHWYKWTADIEPGTYRFSVTITRDDGNYESVGTSTSVTVVASE